MFFRKSLGLPETSERAVEGRNHPLRVLVRVPCSRGPLSIGDGHAPSMRDARPQLRDASFCWGRGVPPVWEMLAPDSEMYLSPGDAYSPCMRDARPRLRDAPLCWGRLLPLHE